MDKIYNQNEGKVIKLKIIIFNLEENILLIIILLY